MSPRDKTRTRRPAERRRPRAGNPAHDDVVLRLVVGPALVFYSGCRSVNCLRRGTASQYSEEGASQGVAAFAPSASRLSLSGSSDITSAFCSGVLTLEAAIARPAGADDRKKRQKTARFLIANSRLETLLTHRKQTPAPLSNSEFSHVFHPWPCTPLPGAPYRRPVARHSLALTLRSKEGSPITCLPSRSSAKAGQCISNRQLARLESLPTYRKQTPAAHSYRQLLRCCNPSPRTHLAAARGRA